MAWWTVDLAISIKEQLENSKNVRGNLFFGNVGFLQEL